MQQGLSIKISLIPAITIVTDLIENDSTIGDSDGHTKGQAGTTGQEDHGEHDHDDDPNAAGKIFLCNLFFICDFIKLYLCIYDDMIT